MVKKIFSDRQLAGLLESIPRDLDPEEEAPVESSDESSDSQGSVERQLATEHYIEVAKSKLRKREEIALGPKYAGSRVSRKGLEETENITSSLDDDEDDDELAESEPFPDPKASDMDIDEIEKDVDSDKAFGEVTFRDAGRIVRANGANKDRESAAESMLGIDEENTDLKSSKLNGLQGAEDDDVQDDDDFESLFDKETSSSDSEEENLEQDDDHYEKSSSGQSISDASEIIEEPEGSDSDEDEEQVDEDEKLQRAELRKIMVEDQRTVTATISQANKVDAIKGMAVKEQRETFDSLLNVRIRLQKALVATNSMTTVEKKNMNDSLPYTVAEEAALKLLDTLDALRHDMNIAAGSATVGRKRKRMVDVDTPSPEIWSNLQDSESKAIEIRQSTLKKWSGRVQGASALPVTSKLNNMARPQMVTDILEEQLSNLDRLIKRTHVPRSCAPVQAKLKIAEDPHIYDDADFYQLLLKELVDQRMMDSSNNSKATGDRDRPISQWAAVKEAKTKKIVDTKASKGRKMRYNVHEKLQNFMAPEDRGTWEQDAIDRFFGTLLGQKMSLGEEDMDENGSDEDERMPLAEEALMLFRS